MNLTTPAEIDTAISAKLDEMAKAAHTVACKQTTCLHMAGARYYYRGRQRVTDMTEAECREILAANAEVRNLGAGKTGAEAIAQLDAAQAAYAALAAENKALQALYTGWSRFMVVTSSNGHIHSSMHCSTCRWTTTFGWMPHLSGKTQAEAIEFFGQAAECLCSVCFPDAPVARMDGNLTAKQRTALLAGETPATVATKVYGPGSGQAATVTRQGYAAGNWAECPVCHAHVGGQGSRVRKHEAKA